VKVFQNIPMMLLRTEAYSIEMTNSQFPFK